MSSYTAEQYQKDRAELNLSVKEWIAELGFSVDSHKSYNSGRMDIPPGVANHIRRLKELKELRK